MSDRFIYDFFCVGTASLIALYGLLALVRGLSRTRPELALLHPVLAAFSLRLLAAGSISLSTLGESLRGGDEQGFILGAKRLAGVDVGSLAGYPDPKGLHVALFSLQMRVLGTDVTELALRATQIGLAVAGLALIAAAVHDVAGTRAATITAWVLAVEPTNIFFSGILHKEPLLLLAEGLVAFGGARMWARPRISSLLVLAAGCGIALATRPYVGWFLIAAAAAVTLHASIRSRQRAAGDAVVLAASVVLLAALTVPVVYQATSNANLKARLQNHQNANTNDSSNLKLEKVNYSTRTDVVLNLPRRIRDVLLRPYPWQLNNPAQQFGLLGTLVALAMLVMLGNLVWIRRGRLVRLAGPLIYPAAFILVAYALSAGNAGTAFRYRTHIVALGLAIVVALRFSNQVLQAEEQGESGPRAEVLAGYDPALAS